MDRCEKSAGVYRIGFQWLGMPEGQPERMAVMSHYDPQRQNLEIETGVPLVAEICEHELEWLNGMPGFTYNPYWRFTLERLSEPPPPPPDPRIPERLKEFVSTVAFASQMGELNVEKATSNLRNLERQKYADLAPLTDDELHAIVANEVAL